MEEPKPIQSSCTCHIELNGKTTLFKIDTGAEVSAVTEQTFNSIAPAVQLNKPSKVWVIFEGEKFHEFHELSLIRENFPCEIAEVSVAVLVTAMHS